MNHNNILRSYFSDSGGKGCLQRVKRWCDRVIREDLRPGGQDGGSSKCSALQTKNMWTANHQSERPSRDHRRALYEEHGNPAIGSHHSWAR